MSTSGGDARTSGIIHEDVTVKAWDSYGGPEATIQYHTSKRLITHAGTTVRLFLAKAPSPTHGLTDESWLRAGGKRWTRECRWSVVASCRSDGNGVVFSYRYK